MLPESKYHNYNLYLYNLKLYQHHIHKLTKLVTLYKIAHCNYTICTTRYYINMNCKPQYIVPTTHKSTLKPLYIENRPQRILSTLLI